MIYAPSSGNDGKKDLMFYVKCFGGGEGDVF